MGGLLFAVLAVSAAASEPACLQDDLPAVGPSRSSLRREAIEACTRLILGDPADPLPYYRRALARYVGPSPERGWNAPPFFDLRVSEEPGPVVADLELALGLAERREFAHAGAAWLKLGYLQASRGAWLGAAKAWTEAAAFDDTGTEARARLPFARRRLVAPERFIASPPEACEGLMIWDCLLVHGCLPDSKSLAGGDRGALEYRGCRGRPKGLRAQAVEYDCSLLDEETCPDATRCRWRRGACVPR